MKLTYRDLYGDNVEDLVYSLVDVDMRSIVLMPDPVKYIHINNIRTRSRLAYMPKSRPIIIPFTVGKYNLSLDYGFFIN